MSHSRITSAGASGRDDRLASRLRARILIEEPVDTSDGAGGYQRIWQSVATVYAEVAPRISSGGESVRDHQILHTATTRFVIRHREDVTPKMRIVYRARMFNIRNIVSIRGRDAAMEIYAEEGVAT